MHACPTPQDGSASRRFGWISEFERAEVQGYSIPLHQRSAESILPVIIIMVIDYLLSLRFALYNYTGSLVQRTEATRRFPEHTLSEHLESFSRHVKDSSQLTARVLCKPSKTKKKRASMCSLITRIEHVSWGRYYWNVLWRHSFQVYMT